MRRIGVGLLLLVLAGCGRSERLNGGGSSFVYPIMLKWSRTYAAERGVQVDYQSTGSGNGIQQMLAGTVHFGCTDEPLSEERRASARGDIVHIPLVMGGIVPVYNLPGVDGRLQFDGSTLAGIFLGMIDRWNHPDLMALNPGVALPDQKILFVGRSDPSGTTAVFAEYLAMAAPQLWAEKSMGPTGTSIRWPAGEAQRGNEGVAGLIRRVPGSLGYVELKYATDVGLDYGAVRNRAGRFVIASPDSVAAAAAASLTTIPPNLCFSLIDAPGAASYPIAGTVWAVYRRDHATKELTDFVRWVTDPDGGQASTRAAGYAPLPAALVDAIRRELDGRP